MSDAMINEENEDEIDAHSSSIAETYMGELGGETAFDVSFFPKISLVSPTAQVLVTRLVLTEVNDGPELFSRQCNAAVLLNLVDAIASNCRFALESMDEHKSGILYLTLSKEELIASVKSAAEALNHIAPLLERLQKDFDGDD